MKIAPRYLFGAALSVLVLCGIWSCASTQSTVNKIETSVPESTSIANGSSPWTSLAALDSDARFHFVVVSDNTGGERAGVFESAMERINLMQPAFVVSVGDLIEGYTENQIQLVAEWEKFDSYVDKLAAPFFYVPGNHDYSNQVMADLWAERYGPSYYSFVYKDVLFVVLNSALFYREGMEGHDTRFEDWTVEQDAQLAWLADTLDTHSEVRWTFVLTHRPYWRKSWMKPMTEDEPVSTTGPWPRHKGGVAEWEQVTALLDDRDYTAFAGHMHTYEYDPGPEGPHTHEKIALATTGGVSNLRGVQYGEFDHFVWMTMTEDGPVMANILLEGVLEKNHEMPLQRPYWIPGVKEPDN
ncbi:MAG: metallophosphoesterase [Pseudomonadota bacterium]